jgi:hypothetical protein
MNKQDASPIKNWTEVERRLKGIYKDIETASTQIIQINNELSSITQSLLINLKDYMNQGEISLWFFSGIPTLSNEPYINWTTPEDHAGDLYYDRSAGLVYQFTGTDWELLDDEKIVETMAITNADLKPNDNERKVFLQQPTPPYEVGDWWIRDNGVLYICQSDSGATFNETDFLLSGFYSLTVANRTANDVSVIQSTITQITEEYAKLIDLATVGNSIIAGENIRTATQSEKKNIELLQNALSIVSATDIYKYHFNLQDSSEKKHIGFLIGNQYNCSPEILTTDSQGRTIGVEIFSVVSVLWQAVKELQNEINNL